MATDLTHKRVPDEEIAPVRVVVADEVQRVDREVVELVGGDGGDELVQLLERLHLRADDDHLLLAKADDVVDQLDDRGELLVDLLAEYKWLLSVD